MEDFYKTFIYGKALTPRSQGFVIFYDGDFPPLDVV